jgi:alkylation response protein AidB-like acyl-CoA dehydrogenase
MTEASWAACADPLDPVEVERTLRAALHAGHLALPLPGGGHTGERLRALAEVGAVDLTIARLVEAHTDAVAILAEAGCVSPSGLLGVWASGGPANRVAARRRPGGWALHGTKELCSGAGLVEHALVPVDCAGGGSGRVEERLALVGVRHRSVSVDLSSWRTTTLSGTATGAVTFDGTPLDDTSIVGGPGFYLERAGFWYGAVGVAAVWAGAATAIVVAARDAAASATRDDPHLLAHLGAMTAAARGLRAVLASAASEIDEDGPHGPSPDGAVRALAVRHLVERWCSEIVDRAGRALGPRPLVHDPAHARRIAELGLYVRQDHAERDLEALGRHAVAARFDPR